VGPERRAIAVVLVALLLLLVRPALADDVDAEARDIGRTLRCPVCQNLSVADSPSELATQMRAVIRAKVAAGESRQQVLDYFVDRYGEDVLLDPPKRGFGLLVWAGPPLVLAIGAAILGLVIARWRRTPTPGRPGTPDGASSDDVAAYAARLRRDVARGLEVDST
jgi:cytochrome c-type biogenesis protein CcmH